jgi:hypothetical protein
MLDAGRFRLSEKPMAVRLAVKTNKVAYTEKYSVIKTKAVYLPSGGRNRRDEDGKVP